MERPRGGNGAWADYPWLGTDKFVFVEDTTIFGSLETVEMATLTPRAAHASSFVTPISANATVSAHGTDNGAGRGTRCAEIYNNIFDWDGGAPARLPDRDVYMAR